VAGYIIYKKITSNTPTTDVSVINGVKVVKVPNMLGRVWDVLTHKLKYKK